MSYFQDLKQSSSSISSLMFTTEPLEFWSHGGFPHLYEDFQVLSCVKGLLYFYSLPISLSLSPLFLPSSFPLFPPPLFSSLPFPPSLLFQSSCSLSAYSLSLNHDSSVIIYAILFCLFWFILFSSTILDLDDRVWYSRGLPSCLSGKESACNGEGTASVRRIPWRRE